MLPGSGFADTSGSPLDHAVLAGFVAYRLDFETQRGEIWFLAVHPDYQNRDIGTALNRCALEDACARQG